MYANLNNPGSRIITGNDSIVIRDVFQTKRGGTTLDVTGYTPDTIPEGTLLIMETATGVYKPAVLNGGATAYAALPTGHVYAGFVIASVPKSKPFVGVLLRGDVNVAAAPYGLKTASILAAVKSALPLITLTED